MAHFLPEIDKIYLLPADREGRERMKKRTLFEGAECVAIGKSILGEPIECFTVGRGKHRVVYFGAHHALESISTNILYLFMHYILGKERGAPICQGLDTEILLRHFTFFIVPCVNPDGVEIRLRNGSDSPLKERLTRMSGGSFALWQANARGVDLNHNYECGFYAYKRLERERGIEAGTTLYSGEYPESEPESFAAANLVRTLYPDAVLSLHTQGREIYFGPRKSAAASRIADRLSALCGYTKAIPEGTAQYGGLCDYTASLGIPSFTVELGKGKNPLPESEIPSIFSATFRSFALLPTFL